MLEVAERRASVAIGVALVALILLSGCAATKPPLVHGARVDVSYSEFISYDASGREVARAPYVSKSDSAVGVLRRALGAPKSTKITRYDYKGYGTSEVSRYQWNGLNYIVSTSKGVSRGSVSVSQARVNGVPIVALGRWRVNGEFPDQGAQAQCALEVAGPGIAGFFASFTPTRVNSLTRKHHAGAVGFFEDDRHHGYLSMFTAPRLEQLC